MVRKQAKKNYLVLLILIIIVGIFSLHLFKTYNKSIIFTAQKNNLSGILAFIRSDNLWISNNGIEKQLTTDAIPAQIPFWSGVPDLWYGYPQISPDGKKIVFLKLTKSNTETESLYVSNLDGSMMKKISDNVGWAKFILQWTKNSNSVYYSNVIPTQNTNDYYPVGIYKVSLDDNKNEKVAQYQPTGGGCGGGSFDISDHMVEAEGLNAIGEKSQVFQLSPNNNYLIYTLNCFGKGIGIFNLQNNQELILGTEITNAVISHASSKVAAIKDSNILIFDIRSGRLLSTIPLTTNPTNLIWSPDDSSIYYVSIIGTSVLKVPDSLAIKVLESSSVAYAINKLIIGKVVVENASTSQITHLDGHDARLIGFTADKSNLIFSLVENSTNLYQHIVKGKKLADLVKYYPRINISEVNLTTGKVEGLINDSAQASYNPN